MSERGDGGADLAFERSERSSDKDQRGMDAATRNTIVRGSLVVLLVIGLAFLLVQLAEVLLLVFAAAVVATLLRAIADPLARRGLPEKLAVFAAVLVVAGVLALSGWLFGSTLAAQLEDIGQRLPQAWASLQERLRTLPLGDRLVQGLSDVAQPGADIAGRIASYVGSAAVGILNIFIVFVGGVYLAAAPATYAKGLARLFPESDRRSVYEAMLALGPALRQFLLGQLATMVILGVLIGAGLALVGAPSPVALGIIAGLLNFIPFFGSFLGAVPGVLLTLAVDPSLALYAVGVYFIVQQIEGDAISPMIQQRAVDLPPALLVFSVLGMGVLFGPVGIIVAAPLTVVLYTLVVKLYSRDALGDDVSVPGAKKAT